MLPKAVIIPNITQNIPPMIGSGITINTAPNLLMTPCNNISKQAYWITLRLPIYKLILLDRFRPQTYFFVNET